MTPTPDISQLLSRSPVVPVVRISRSADAPALAEALLAGGITVMEITLRTESALEAMAAVRRSVPDMLVGAGTVVQAEQVDQAEQAGAQFLVSPGCTPALAEAVLARPLPCLPGVMTPSEVMTAMAAGFTALKFFPAGAAGGLAMLKALAGPFSGVTFCPTGGIGASNFTDFLALDNVACVGGSWLTPADALASRDWARVTRLAREARDRAGDNP